MSVERRIRRSKAHEVLLGELADEVFTTMADALVFAASVGYESRVRSEFEAAAEPIRFSTFEARDSAHIIDLLAFAESGEVAILADARLEDRIAIFEELAEGGMAQIETRRRAEGDLLNACLSFLGEAGAESLEADILRELDGV
jgi:dnd system-associated protein 4